MKRLTLSAALIAAASLSCTDPAGLPVRGARAMQPLPAYASWWSMTETCAATTGSFRDVSWYRVDADEFRIDGLAYHGLYDPRTHAIILARSVLEDGPVVRHEMLHAILRTPGHPVEMFLDRCGDVVHCAPICHLRD